MKKFLMSIKRTFSCSSPRDIAQRNLEFHQRRLILARDAVHAANTTLIYHERAIQDLQRMLESEAQK